MISHIFPLIPYFVVNFLAFFFGSKLHIFRIIKFAGVGDFFSSPLQQKKKVPIPAAPEGGACNQFVWCLLRFVCIFFIFCFFYFFWGCVSEGLHCNSPLARSPAPVAAAPPKPEGPTPSDTAGPGPQRTAKTWRSSSATTRPGGGAGLPVAPCRPLAGMGNFGGLAVCVQRLTAAAPHPFHYERHLFLCSFFLLFLIYFYFILFIHSCIYLYFIYFSLWGFYLVFPF